MKVIKQIIAVICGQSLVKLKEVNEETETKRRELDNRLNEVTRATLNGEEEWFLQLVRKNPECALEVIKECTDNDK